MTVYLFKNIYIRGKWKNNWEIRVNDNGNITYSGLPESREFISVEGPVLPGFINAHSHAFQYAMAGLSESFSGNKEDFWSWRENMYKLALSISPDQLESIASMLYAEMLCNGYTQVVEFHYLHHDLNGKEYEQVSLLGETLAMAAQNTGIGITLAPMYYNTGGFGKPAQTDQRRFISAGLNQYRRLLESSSKSILKYNNARIGYGAHSLRACTKEDLGLLLSEFSDFGPFHMHISEQVKEVSECEEYYGARPVKWLDSEFGLTDKMNLVHCTHLNNEELDLLANNKVNAVICPGTEGNLGDGTFRFSEYIQKGGRFCIGSDSHIGLNAAEELRWLDYQQRLEYRLRNTLQVEGSRGKFLYDESLHNGLVASGSMSVFSEGDFFKAIELDPLHPLIAETAERRWLDSLIYHGDRSMIRSVYSGTEKVIEEGTHKKVDNFRSNFTEAMRELKSRF